MGDKFLSEKFFWLDLSKLVLKLSILKSKVFPIHIMGNITILVLHNIGQWSRYLRLFCKYSMV